LTPHTEYNRSLLFYPFYLRMSLNRQIVHTPPPPFEPSWCCTQFIWTPFTPLPSPNHAASHALCLQYHLRLHEHTLYPPPQSHHRIRTSMRITHSQTLIHTGMHATQLSDTSISHCTCAALLHLRTRDLTQPTASLSYLWLKCPCRSQVRGNHATVR
jgi:hypothetical protein